MSSHSTDYDYTSIRCFLASEETRLRDFRGGADPWRDPMLGNYLGGIKAALTALSTAGFAWCGSDHPGGCLVGNTPGVCVVRSNLETTTVGEEPPPCPDPESGFRATMWALDALTRAASSRGVAMDDTPFECGVYRCCDGHFHWYWGTR